MAINFPSNPSNNQIYSANTKSWIFTGVAWKALNAGGSVVTTNRTTTTATANQTIFTAPSYAPGANQVSVFINGVRQYSSDYAESTSTSITLTTGAIVGDNVLVEVNGYVTNSINVNAPLIVDDSVTNQVRYPLMSPTTSGSLTSVNTASSDLSFNPGTNTLNVNGTITTSNLNIGSTNVLDYIITYNLAFG